MVATGQIVVRFENETARDASTSSPEWAARHGIDDATAA